MERRWNETDRGKPQYFGKNLSQYHFFHHKYHMDWPPESNSGFRGKRPATTRLNHGTAAEIQIGLETLPNDTLIFMVVTIPH
jgi:hypothetical protein